MEMGWKIFEMFINLLYGVVFTQFIIRYFGYKEKIRYKKIFAGILILLLFSAITINNILFPYYEGYRGIVYIMIVFGFSWLVLKGNIFEKIFISLLENVLLLIVSTLVVPTISHIFRADISDILTMESSGGRFIVIVLAIIIYSFTLELVIFIKRKNNELKLKQWIIILCVPLISSILMISIFESGISEQESLIYLVSNIVSIVSILILNVLTYFIISELAQNNKIETEYKMLKQSKSYEEKNIEDIQKIYDEARVIRHDAKYRNDCIIGELQNIPDISPAQQVQIDKIKKSLIDLDEQILKINHKVITGNSVIDNILNYKINSAQTAGIEVSYYIDNSSPIEIPNIDICRVFGNLLDNAAEACQYVEKNKNIEIRMYRKKVYRCIMVSNTINGSVLKTNPNLFSTKSEKDIHGFGLKSIKKIVEKYDGFFNFYESDSRIFFEVLLAEVDLQDKI
jgi:signal transduction histidine kinase